jgi:hypothetical protein
MRFIPFSHTLIDAFLTPLSMTPGDEDNAQRLRNNDFHLIPFVMPEGNYKGIAWTREAANLKIT